MVKSKLIKVKEVISVATICTNFIVASLYQVRGTLGTEEVLFRFRR